MPQAMTVSPDQLNPTDKLCIRVLREGRATAAYIADVGDYSTGNVRTRLRRLHEHNHIAQIYDGLYQLIDDPLDGQEIDLGPEIEDRLAADQVDRLSLHLTPPADEREHDATPSTSITEPEAVPSESASTDASSDSEPRPGAAANVSPGVHDVVEEVAESWEDTDDRLAARKAAARAVLKHAVSTGDAVGKSEAVDQFFDAHPVDGQNEETWWRKNVRPVLKEVGQYSQGQRGYVVDLESS